MPFLEVLQLYSEYYKHDPGNGVVFVTIEAMTQVRLLQLGGITLYTIVFALLLSQLETPLWVSMIILFGVPLVVLATRERLRVAPVVIGTLIFGTGILLLDAVAHQTGSWYVLSPHTWRLFGVISVESIAFTTGLVWYYIVLYEYFFDDLASASSVVWQRRMLPLYILPVGLGMALVSMLYVFVVSFAFAWLLGILALVVLVCALIGAQRSVVGIGKRAVFFALTVLPLSFVFEWFALMHDVRFFAFPSDYLLSFTVLGYLIPIEEVALLFLLPFSVALLYELYLDDGV